MAAKKATKQNANAVARMLYESNGYSVPDTKDFSAAHHPQEVAAWNQACAVFKFITGEAPEQVDGRARLRAIFEKD